MKKITFLLWMVIAAMLSGPVHAADELTDISFIPDPEVAQKSLTKITVRFSDANWGISGNVDVSGITLTRKGSPEILYALPEPAVDYSKLYLEFGYKGDSEPTTITTEGIYSLHIPAGAVTALSTNRPCAEINVDFTISSEVITEMDIYELDPAGGTVDEISTIAISFPQSDGLDWFYNDLFGKGNFSGITLIRKENPATRYTAVKKAFDNNATVTLAFVKEGESEITTISDPGTYILNIPSGTFQKDFSDLKNSEISAEYTIKSAMPQEFSGMIANPADGSAVGQISSLTLEFPHMTDGLDYPVSNISSATIETPEGQIYYGFNARVGGNYYNRLSIDFAPENAVAINDKMTFTQAGKYKITIPEGTLKVYGKETANSEIIITATVDPTLNFTYRISPDASVAHDRFSEIMITSGESLTSMSLNPECTQPATISLDDTVYNLEATQKDNQTVIFNARADAVASVGEWTVTIPARYFNGMNNDGITIVNASEIISKYIVKEPEHFDFSVTPDNGATIEFFKNITIEFTGNNLKNVNIDESGELPVIVSSKGEIHTLTGRISGRYVILSLTEGTELENGDYSLSIPQGYILTIDKENLTAKVDAILSSFTVSKKGVSDYTDGILFLNEGWFGHECGSLNFLSNSGEWTYDAFLRNNPDHNLGITTQFGQCFGDKIYMVSKQAEDEGSGGVFTVVDAATLKYIKGIKLLPDEQSQPRAFCAWDEHKGYLSTKDRIYVVDLDRMEATSVVPGTDIYTSFDSNGEMLRYANHVFAIRQSSGVDAIDPETEEVVKIEAELAEAFAVTPDGSLYVATRNEANEFIKISPTTLSIVEAYDIDVDRAKIANVWSTWRKAPLATDIHTNRVYYVTQKTIDESPAGTRTVSCYDFDTKTFTEDFITLPGVSDGEDADWILYGEGVSVDPSTGMILLSAVEAGYGEHYSHNRVFYADPSTGKILKDRTLILDNHYWFPAMTLYPDFEAPVIDISGLDLSDQSEMFRLDIASRTTLTAGNRHLINYSIKNLDGSLCDIFQTSTPGVFEVYASGTISLEVSADYQGKISTVTLSGNLASVPELKSGEKTHFDIYNLQGIRVKTDATIQDINNLPSGIYIAGGKKYIVR